MNSKVKRIEQPDFKVLEIQRPDYSYGYKDRPLNIRRAGYNNYLDSCIYVGSNDIASAGTGKLDETVAFIPTGGLKRDGIVDGIQIPTQGTYMIVGDVRADTSGTDIYVVSAYIESDKNDPGGTPESIYESKALTMDDGTTIPIVYVDNFKKGDKIWFWGNNQFASEITFAGYISVIKLS